MDKWAGVTLDWYDDDGETLKRVFPTIESLPEVIKTASIRPYRSLVHEDFALVAIDSGRILRKYACYDPASTAMSVVYFMEQGRHKLPATAVKMAAGNLTMACLAQDLVPPAEMVRAAGYEKLSEAMVGAGSEPVATGQATEALGQARATMNSATPALSTPTSGPQAAPSTSGLGNLGQTKTSMLGMPTPQMQQPKPAAPAAPKPPPGPIAEAAQGIATVLKAKNQAEQPATEGPSGPEAVDITGQEPAPKLAARSTNPSDYAVVMPNGQMLYPIDSWGNVKKAEAYWLEERRRMLPEMRRQYAVKLASRAATMGVHIDGEIHEAAAPEYASNGHLQAALAMRKVAFPKKSSQHDFLDGLFQEKTAGLHPDVYAECLRRFDVQEGMNQGWDQAILDPYSSTFSLEKIAEVVWESGVDRVTDQQLHGLAANHGGGLVKIYSQDFIQGFEKDPVKVFKGLPDAQKRLLARLADDMAHQGGSEGQVPLTVGTKPNEQKAG